MAGEYDGEVLGSAAELRAMFKVPAEHQHQLSDGVCFARWIGSGSGLPVILLGGGTGCALFYKAFAEKLSAQYNGPVLIWDRFNIGFSDRVPKNGLVLWTRQMLELMDILAIKKAHLACFSLASISGAYFAVEHPSRVARIALVSPILGGVRQDTQLSKQIQKMVKVPSCLRGCLGEIIFKRKLVPRLYQRCEGQVKEGGDPDGLPVAKQMYRVRGTARSFVEYMLLDETFITYQTKGAFELVKRLCQLKIPVLQRNYLQDKDVDRLGFVKIVGMLAEDGHPACIADEKPGEHHMFYVDDMRATLAGFFQAHSG